VNAGSRQSRSGTIRFADVFKIARAARFVKSLLSPGRAAQCVGARAIVDDDRADQHVVQQPAAVVEEGDQKDQRR
jgi:hypothetical protein